MIQSTFMSSVKNKQSKHIVANSKKILVQTHVTSIEHNLYKGIFPKFNEAFSNLGRRYSIIKTLIILYLVMQMNQECKRFDRPQNKDKWLKIFKVSSSWKLILDKAKTYYY